MTEGLLGVETEYALTVLKRDGGRFDRAASMRALLEIVRSRYSHLRDRGGTGVFLQNGGRLYIDCGDHPEFATPECSDPLDAVRYVQAGERILSRAADELAARHKRGSEAVLLRCNVDYSGTGATWGCHESYLYRSDPAKLPSQIIPHLVSRIIFTGAGGFDSLRSGGLHFTLSPRVHHLGRDVSDDSTHLRGIFHTKNEPLGEGYNRLHVLCGESLCSETAAWLRIGTTALVVALIDGGICPGNGLRLESPLSAMRKFAGDPSCRQEAMVTDERRTAIAIQRHYLQLAEQHLHARFMPPWAQQVCIAWRHMLDRLGGAPESVAATLDWAMKWALYTRRIERHGLTWETVGHWSHIVERLVEALSPEGKQRLPLRLVALLGDSAFARGARRQLRPRLVEAGLKWDQLSSFLRLREELLEVDARFGQLGRNGIFAALDEAGVLSHRIDGLGDVEEAVLVPPKRGRARLRGRLVRQLSGKVGSYVCDWASLWDHTTGRWVDLRDPFAESASWQRFVPDERQLLFDRRASGPMRLERRLDTALALIGEARHARSLRLLDEVIRFAHPIGDRATIRSALLWSAIAEQARGQVLAAAHPLARVISLAGEADDDEISYMALSRRALISLDLLHELADIESAVHETERFSARPGCWSWNSRGFLVRARLEEARGNYEAALAAIDAAIAALPADPHPFHDLSYWRTQCSLLLRLGRLKDARASLRQLGDSPGSGARRRPALMICCLQSELARHEGRFDVALDWARRAARRGSDSEDHVERLWSATSLVRALIATGSMQEADKPLTSLLPVRVGEIGADRYAVRLLWADFHLNRARIAGGLPPVDPETGHESFNFVSPPPRYGESSAAEVTRKFVVASMAYRTALREGRWVDTRLGSVRRSREVRSRLDLLEQSRQRITERPSAPTEEAQLCLNVRGQ